MTVLYTVLAILIAGAPIYAQPILPTQFVTESWGTKTGLPEETIFAVTQTPDGYLWLATANGLVQYDGASFRTYQPRTDLGGSVKREITKVGLGAGNSLWVFSRGLGLLQFENGVFRYPHKYPTPCLAEEIIREDNSTVVVCQERVLRFQGDRVTELASKAIHSAATFSSAARDDAGRLWVGSTAGNLVQLSTDGDLLGSFGLKEGIPRARVNFILPAQNGGLWLATDEGLALFKNGHVKLLTMQDGLTSNTIRRLRYARDGALWIGTRNGMCIYRDGRMESFANVPDLPPDTVQTIFEDREEIIWITFNETPGIIRLHKPKFRTWGMPEGLLNKRPLAVATIGGTVWVAHQSGLQTIQDGVVRTVQLAADLVDLRSLAVDGIGRLWAAGRGGVYIVDPKTRQFSRPILPPKPGPIFNLTSDRNGRVWIAAENGLYLGEGTKIRPAPISGLPVILSRTDVRQSRDGRLWLSVAYAGLFEIQDGKAVKVPLGADRELERIHCFYIDAANDFWFGFDGGGLARWRNGALARFGNRTVAPQNFVYHLGEDTSGYLWLGLRAGLSRINKAELNAYLDGRAAEPKGDFYDIGHGMRSYNFGLANTTVPSLEPADVLWFGHLQGVLRIDTRHMPVNPLKPPVHLVEVVADDKRLPLQGPVTVPAGTGMLKFSFSVPSLLDGSHVQTRYRLEPFDVTWRNSPTRSITYSWVPPGTYTFSVKASNNDGVWNDQGASVRVIVLPGFYQTWWFRLLMLASLGAAVAGIFRWRTRRLSREKSELERRVVERTTELAQATLRAENAAQAKSDFLATMSHEIRTPMHGVLGNLELLAGTPLNAAQQEYLNTSRNSSASLLALLNEVLDLSKLDAGRMVLHAAPFSLRHTVDDVALLLQAPANLSKTSISVSYASCTPEHFRGDEMRIRQVLFNLAGNAVKFTDKGQVHIEVSGEPNRDETWDLRICVRDTGIGVPQDRVSQLFDSFFQVNSSTSRRYQGTGLGLAICQRLATLMNGSITVESELGKGSVFSFLVSLPKAEIRSEAVAPAAPPVHQRFDIDVLVAEDNPVNQRLATAMLARLGCRVTLAGSGLEAVELAGKSHFPIIFMDCQMPEMDGFEASRHLRERLGSAPVIIAMTANALPGDRERCLAAGMNDYIAKPFQLAGLAQVLSRYVSEESGAVKETADFVAACGSG